MIFKQNKVMIKRSELNRLHKEREFSRLGHWQLIGDSSKRSFCLGMVAHTVISAIKRLK